MINQPFTNYQMLLNLINSLIYLFDTSDAFYVLQDCKFSHKLHVNLLNLAIPTFRCPVHTITFKFTSLFYSVSQRNESQMIMETK